MVARLKDKVALVTGGAQGIGRAIAGLFAAEGAVVGLLDIRADEAEKAAAAIRAEGGRAHSFAGDVSQRDTFVLAVDTLEQQYGRFDILVNNAIWVRYNSIDAITEKILTRMVGTGFNSVVWGIQVAAPAMSRSGGGSIINIASAAGFLGIPSAMVYCGVKAGVLGLTRSASVDLGASKIRVNAIAPGSVVTEGVSINVDATMRAKRIARTPMGRLGTVDDISAAALFLASDDSTFITGESLLVDGGVTHAFA
jgi:NAD(P)-dependent dehydrogenase (short-subunit alcohol dehydrogenase family)